jgi:hypothetical protein
MERVDDDIEAAQVALFDRAADGRFEFFHHLCQAPGVEGTCGREVDRERAAVLAPQLASDESAPLEPVEHVRQGGAFRSELAMEGRDGYGTSTCDLDEDVYLGLRDPELATRALGMDSDQVGRAFETCEHFTHIVYYDIGWMRR